MRYRLYSRLGVSTSNIAKILGLSLATNWFGYMALAGAVFSSGVLVTVPPPGWKLSSGALRGVGCVTGAGAAWATWRRASFLKSAAWSIPQASRSTCRRCAWPACSWLLGALNS